MGGWRAELIEELGRLADEHERGDPSDRGRGAKPTPTSSVQTAYSGAERSVQTKTLPNHGPESEPAFVPQDGDFFVDGQWVRPAPKPAPPEKPLPNLELPDFPVINEPAPRIQGPGWELVNKAASMFDAKSVRILEGDELARANRFFNDPKNCPTGPFGDTYDPWVYDKPLARLLQDPNATISAFDSMTLSLEPLNLRARPVWDYVMAQIEKGRHRATLRHGRAIAHSMRQDGRIKPEVRAIKKKRVRKKTKAKKS